MEPDNLVIAFVIVITHLIGVTCDRANDQLLEWAAEHRNQGPVRAVDQRGCPYSSLTTTLGVGGTRGPLLLEDFNFIEHLAHAVRERTSERYTHAKGFTVKGYFVLTHDISKFTRARLYNNIGKKTPVAVRFSTAVGSVGSADMVRDNRGMAIKHYTEDGNFDMVCNAFPMFGIRDPFLYPAQTSSRKGNPRTGFRDPNIYWDFLSLRPESTLFILTLFSDRGTPDGYRFSNYAGGSTFKMVNAVGDPYYVKFHYRSNQGVRSVTPENATAICGKDPWYAARDIYNAIENGNYPSWTMYIQVMTFEQAEAYRWNPFDATKVWLFKDFPLLPVGQIILNKNVDNNFADNEAIGFNPANLVPGIEPSPDRILLGRLLAYGEELRYRLGPNWQQLPINRPLFPVNGYERNGLGDVDSQGSAPDYFPNSFGGPVIDPWGNQSVTFVRGLVSQRDTGGDDNFSQAQYFWKYCFPEDEKKRIIANIGKHMSRAHVSIRTQAIDNMFTPVDRNLAASIATEIQRILQNANTPSGSSGLNAYLDRSGY